MDNDHASQILWWYPLLEQGLSTRETKISWKLMQESRTGSLRKQNYPRPLFFQSKKRRKPTLTSTPNYLWSVILTKFCKFCSNKWVRLHVDMLFYLKQKVECPYFSFWTGENKPALIPRDGSGFSHAAGRGWDMLHLGQIILSMSSSCRLQQSEIQWPAWTEQHPLHDLPREGNAGMAQTGCAQKLGQSAGTKGGRIVFTVPNVSL